MLFRSLKSRLAGRRASHIYMGRLLARKASVGLTRTIPADHAQKMPPVWHPVFRTHPVTGRKKSWEAEPPEDLQALIDALDFDRYAEEDDEDEGEPEWYEGEADDDDED